MWDELYFLTLAVLNLLYNFKREILPKRKKKGKWLEKMWHIYTMEFCQATKKDEIMANK